MRGNVALRRSKVYVAGREARGDATATDQALALEHLRAGGFPRGTRSRDVSLYCVDRTWPRVVLSVLGYTDLILVINGGIAIGTYADWPVLYRRILRTPPVGPERLTAVDRRHGRAARPVRQLEPGCTA